MTVQGPCKALQIRESSIKSIASFFLLGQYSLRTGLITRCGNSRSGINSITSEISNQKCARVVQNHAGMVDYSDTACRNRDGYEFGISVFHLWRVKALRPAPFRRPHATMSKM